MAKIRLKDRNSLAFWSSRYLRASGLTGAAIDSAAVYKSAILHYGVSLTYFGILGECRPVSVRSTHLGSFDERVFCFFSFG